MSERLISPNQRLTRNQKNSHDYKYFKEELDNLDRLSFDNESYFALDDNNHGGISEYKRKKTNYDLYNNIVSKEDFEHVCSPYGASEGELPANFSNKDILSGKVKALEGMEMKRPFSFKFIAVNEEATTRKEQEEFGRIKEYVHNMIVLPIEEKLELKYQQEQQGRELTEDETEKIKQKIQEELKVLTPSEVKKYMQREHQDPAEILAHQIMQYLMKKQDIKMKFNKGWKHGLISGETVFWVGEVSGEPCLKVVNPLRFDFDKSPDLDYIEEGEWAAYEMYMMPSEVIKHFGSELSDIEIDEIYEEYNSAESLADESFSFNGDDAYLHSGIRVLHGEWKGLKCIKFVTYKDLETGEIYEEIQDETYTLNKEAGDISERKEWIPFKFEGYKIGKDKYAFLREVPGQHKDLHNLYDCKLSYKGAVYDNLNSQVTSLVDRMKYYQYLYNIIVYRIELLTASDKGKQLLLNMNMIPKQRGFSFEKWMHYLDASKVGFLNPNEEGNKGADITQAAKELDMSLASDIQKYVDLAEYINRRCGESVGITPQIEGQIGQYETASNTATAIVQSANILEPYFELHNNIKKNVLQSLVEVAKEVYSRTQPKHLAYVLDDMSEQLIKMDYDLLENSEYGLFVSNSMKSHEALQMVQQLSHAALQNQAMEMSDVMKIMRSESVPEAEEMLKVSESERIEREQENINATNQAKLESEEKNRQFKREEWAHELRKIELQEKLKTERELQKQTILSMGFNEDKDLDKDGTPDVLEVYKTGVDVDIKQRKQDLDEKKFEQQKQVERKKLEIEEKKAKQAVQKKAIED